MLFQKALTRAIGPLDAEHFSHLIVLATSDADLDPQEELAEHDFLLILLIYEIRNREPEERSFENVYELLNGSNGSTIESILKISDHWINGSVESRTRAVLGVKARLLKVLLADDPNFMP